MRDVKVYNAQHPNDENLAKEGIFHQFGINYEAGPGHFTTAIVEMIDGSIVNVPVESVKFI